MVNDKDIQHLRLAISLARKALQAGDAPFGSVLASASGEVLQTDRNRETTGSDATLHPEFTLARWAEQNLSPTERAESTVYTSGEHCAMCSAAHAWCGLGRIVYASSTEQLGAWRAEYGIGKSPVSPLSIQQVAPGIQVEGPVEGLDQEVRALHVEVWTAQGLTPKAG